MFSSAAMPSDHEAKHLSGRTGLTEMGIGSLHRHVPYVHHYETGIDRGTDRSIEREVHVIEGTTPP